MIRACVSVNLVIVNVVIFLLGSFCFSKVIIQY